MSETAKHTPGRWQVKPSEKPGVTGPYIVAGPVDVGVGELMWIEVARVNIHSEQTEHNARLFSAAPDLYAACREALELSSSLSPSAFHNLTAAIAKAEGTTKVAKNG